MGRGERGEGRGLLGQGLSWEQDTDSAAPCHRPKFKQKEEEEEQEVENPLLVPLEEKSVLEERQTSLWFGKVSPTCGAGMREQPRLQQLPRAVLGLTPPSLGLTPPSLGLTPLFLFPGCLRWHRGRCRRGAGAGAGPDVG